MTYNQLTTEKFIEKAKKVHGDKYDYSKVEYVNNHTKVCIICPEHGEFWQTPSSHLTGRGCKKCYNEKQKKSMRMNENVFIEKAKEIHGHKYDYSKTKYIDSSTKVCIICPEHGEFWQTPNNHLRGAGCKKCYEEKRKNTGNGKRKTKEQFIKDAEKTHGNKYDYSKTKYVNSNTKICVICPEHGEFWTRPDHHLNGVGCPVCNDSHLEKEILEFLNKNKIEYIHKCDKKYFSWLEKQHLDFYLPDYNVAIECQGIQHFEPRKRFGGKLAYEKCILLDNRKKIKCDKNGVKLLYYIEKSNYTPDKYNFCDKDVLLKEIKGTC